MPEHSFESPHLLIVGVAWPPETFLANLITGLIESGLKVTLASGTSPNPAWASRPNFTHLYAPKWRGSDAGKMQRLMRQASAAALRSPGDTARFWASPGQNTRLRDRLAEFNRLAPFAGRRWDLIYFPWTSAAIDHLPLFDLGIPVVVSCRGRQINVVPHLPDGQSMRARLRMIFERAARVHCVSDAIQNQAQKFGLNPDKARVIRPAVDAAFFQPPTRPRPPGGRFHLVMTGSLIWRKGYEYALLSMRELRNRGIPFQLNIIGDGPERQRIVYTVHDLDLVENVHLTGRLSPAEVRTQLQQADAFLLTSLSEGISNAALEAMACGLPVVTTDCGGMREAVASGKEGFITPVRDPAALTGALEQLWFNLDLRQQVGSAARQRIETEFQLPGQIKQFRELFATL